MAQSELTEDTLFLACTRPAMWHGVPLEALAINAMATTIFFVVMENPLYMAIGAVIHYAITGKAPVPSVSPAARPADQAPRTTLR